LVFLYTIIFETHGQQNMKDSIMYMSATIFHKGCKQIEIYCVWYATGSVLRILIYHKL